MTSKDVESAQAWIGERPPDNVLVEWNKARAALGLTLPNNEPQRFFATCAAINGARSVVVRVGFPDGESGVLLGRVADRRDRVKFGFISLPGPRMSTVDVIRGGVLVPIGRASVCSRAFVATLWTAGARKIVWHALPMRDELLNGAKECGRCVVAAAEQRYLLQMDLNGDHPLAHRSAKTRSKLRRYDRMFEERFAGAATLEHVTSPEQVRAFCAACEAISQNSYHAAIGYGVRNGEPWWSMLTAAAETRHLRSYLLRCDGVPVAYQNGSVIDGVYYSDGKGFDRRYLEHRPGTILLCRMLADLHAAGVRRVDFGVGESEYKDIFSNTDHQELRITMYAPGARGALNACGARVASMIVRGTDAASASRSGRWVRSKFVRTHGRSRGTHA